MDAGAAEGKERFDEGEATGSGGIGTCHRMGKTDKQADGGFT
ncbi:uncharacterized protein G2W53_019968 [Senna tora]|uniref:Uncharacterized protein n=1 Tax=Senna tora TaxID=362788 RepID=A0A834TVU6_9FABA|nr:uncharacterized protein G2W53_019968 [Senna tora]